MAEWVSPDGQVQGLAVGAAFGEGGRNRQVGAAALQVLLQGAGFTAVAVTPRTFIDRMADVDELIEWGHSSSFGNWPSALPKAHRDTVRARLAERLLPLHDDGQIPLARQLVFASARRYQASSPSQNANAPSATNCASGRR